MKKLIGPDGCEVGEVDGQGRLVGIDLKALRDGCDAMLSTGGDVTLRVSQAVTLLALLEHRHAEPPRPRGLRARVRAALAALLA